MNSKIILLYNFNQMKILGIQIFGEVKNKKYYCNKNEFDISRISENITYGILGRRVRLALDRLFFCLHRNEMAIQLNKNNPIEINNCHVY